MENPPPAPPQAKVALVLGHLLAERFQEHTSNCMLIFYYLFFVCLNKWQHLRLRTLFIYF